MKHDACLFREVVGAVIKRIQNQIQGVKSWSMWRILHKIRIQFLYNIKVKAIYFINLPESQFARYDYVNGDM